MVVAIRDHQHKSVGIREALRSEGWWVVPAGAPADVLLIDLDCERSGYREIIGAYEERGTRIVLYPHGPHPVSAAVWDGILDPYLGVDLCLVPADGHREVLESYGYPNRVEVVGWSVCEQHEWQSQRNERSRVLFCPQHPLGTGYLREELKDANRVAMDRIRTWDAQITVRHVGTLEQNGLAAIPGVTYEQSRMNTAVGSIDEYDLVVARETMLSLAVARGVPAVTFHQVPLTDDPEEGEPTVRAAHWADYADLIRFPHDLEDDYVLFGATTQEPTEWRERFVGAQLDPERLSEQLLGLCGRRGSPAGPQSNGDLQAPARATV